MAYLQRIHIEGYKSIEDLNLELGHLNILIGANGAGKSNLISFFKMLNAVIENRFKLYVAKRGGASAILHFGPKVSPTLKAFLKFDMNAYEIAFEPDTEDRFVFTKEILHFDGMFGAVRVDLGSGHLESNIERHIQNSSRTRKSMGQFITSALKSWKVFHFHDTTDSAPAKQPCNVTDHLYLRNDASNLPAFLNNLKVNSPSHYQSIRETIQLVAPFFDDFEFQTGTHDLDNIYLGWKEKGSDYPMNAFDLSDGTLRFICLAVLLLQPNPPSTILIDEPELGLHPYAISTLASLISSASERTQLIISTQSVSLLNEMPIADVIVVDKEEGKSTFTRTDLEMAKPWLEQYSLGEMWEKNILGGRPSK